MEGYTTFTIDIPNDREDYIKIVSIIEKNLKSNTNNQKATQQDISLFSSHSANTIQEWQNDLEDEVWS